jgi:hypothetical protein
MQQVRLQANKEDFAKHTLKSHRLLNSGDPVPRLKPFKTTHFFVRYAEFIYICSETYFLSALVSSNAKSAPAADTTLKTFVEPFRPKGRPDVSGS